MNKPLQALLQSLLTPGLGYLQTGSRNSFYKTTALFFGVIILGAALKLFTTFWGLSLIIVVLIGIYIFAAVHSVFKAGQADPTIQTPALLKIILTTAFILITGISFANRRVLLGFDIMYMNVPVMQPTVLQGERFLVDTWTYKNNLPKRGDIIAHSFNEQKGIYLNRIIAIEDDNIGIKDGNVFLNGKILFEPYILPVNATKPASKDMKALTVSKGHYFVMGDNRDESFGDSRFSGTISIDNIIGKVTDNISSHEISRIGITLK